MGTNILKDSMDKLIYNVTVNIDHSVHDEWLQWMKETHIPEVMATGCFLESRFSKIVSDDEQGGVTYSVQYLLANEKDFDLYQKDFAPKLQQEHASKYAGKFAAFRTMLSMVAQF